MAPAIIERVRKNESYMFLRPDSEDYPPPWMRIKDARIVNISADRQGLALLFSIGDPRGANPSFENSKTATIRTIEKEENEGKAIAAHCLVSLTERPTQRYRMVMEDIRGLGRTRLRDMLAKELKVISENYNLEYTNNSNEQVATYVLPDLEGHKSERLTASLERGTITGIHLVDSNSTHHMDEIDGAEITRRELKVSLAHVPGQDKTPVIERIKQWAAEENYDRMRLVWNDPEGAGKPEKAWVETAQQDVRDTYFVKQVKVRVDHPLDEACESLRDDLITAICQQVE
ncbi:hypothetical protein CHN51_01575 [Sphingorhabdus sp. YGSMI21]|nr:hypothetical protein CHN51_01575 [Sphingorhabdus sp. YGSMI21]